jgi:hypothetical protein
MSRWGTNTSDSADASGVDTVDGTSGCEIFDGSSRILFGSGSVVFTRLRFETVGGESRDAVPSEDSVGCTVVGRDCGWSNGLPASP